MTCLVDKTLITHGSDFGEQATFTPHKKRVKAAAGLVLPARDSKQFSVIIDDIKLYRPIRFTELPVRGTAALKKPMLFVGKCEPDLSRIGIDVDRFRALASSAE